MIRTFFLVIGIVGLLGACSSNIAVGEFSGYETPPGKTLPGITFYEPALFVVEYSYTQYVDPQTKEIGTLPCQPILQKTELRVLPDFEQKRIILNRPSIFSSTEFSVTLKDGMLVSVGSKASAGGTDFLSKLVGKDALIGGPILHSIDLPDDGAPGMPGAADAIKACNASPGVSGFERLEE